MNHRKNPLPKNDCPNEIVFSKYQGNANDFIFIDLSMFDQEESRENFIKNLQKNAARICDRRLGVGADGIILLNKQEQHFNMIVINADGSFAKNCGNGLRCAAKWCFDNWRISCAQFKIENQFFACHIEDKEIFVDMKHAKIFDQGSIWLESLGVEAEYFDVDVSNLHRIIMLDQKSENFDLVLKDIQKRFFDLDAINIGFVSQKRCGTILSRVFEAGAGWTKSCASGACAAASVLAYKSDSLQKEFVMQQPGGDVKVTVQSGKDETKKYFLVKQSGSAEFVFSGSLKF